MKASRTTITLVAALVGLLAAHGAATAHSKRFDELAPAPVLPPLP